jgi:predicted carbohydrate-binding protein with CBM5 and CBM33 domain
VSLIPVRPGKKLLSETVTVLAATGCLLAGALSGVASAHGSATDPPSRNYGCWNRWGSDFQNPAMATQDPMCWQAWQANPNAMWNWNGLYRENVRGNHQAAIPDGQLCSAGHTESGRYDALDTVGPWQTVNKGRRFTLTITDQARHGADYLRVYLTKQGFDPSRQALGWGNLDLVSEAGRIAPAGEYRIDVDAGARTGRHVVYTVWQASHMDQSYYFCSDVVFTGQ